MGIKNFRHPVAERQVGEGDDRGGHIARHATRDGIAPDRLDRLGFADRSQRDRSVAAHRVAGLDEHSRLDAVTAGDVGLELVEQIGVAAFDPQMMMGIDDRQVGLDHRLVMTLQPHRIGRRVSIPSCYLETHPTAPDIQLIHRTCFGFRKKARRF